MKRRLKSSVVGQLCSDPRKLGQLQSVFAAFRLEFGDYNRYFKERNKVQHRVIPDYLYDRN